jgi:protocatechuate 3,4-dioxygenase beta subunit
MFALAALLALGLTLGLPAQSKKDQEKREAQLRTVRGTVTDRSDNPVSDAVVYLKNVKTQAVKTSYADNDGKYRFSGLDPNVDYEIHAEHEDSASPKRTVSSFDSRKEIVIQLKLTKKRGDT